MKNNLTNKPVGVTLRRTHLQGAFMASEVQLPYFDMVLQMLDSSNADFQKAFGRHVHWGFWENPSLATGSAEDFGQAAEDMCTQVFEAAELGPGQKILDVGCGFGGTISSLNERWQPLELVGLNIDPRQLERARSLVAPSSPNTITFVQGDACQLPFPDHSFDRILAIECIFHFPSRDRFFAEARRVLRPGGRLFVSDIVPDRSLLALGSLFRLIMGSGLDRTYGDINVGCSIQRYLSLAGEHGFSDARVRNVTRQTLPTHPFVRRLLKANAPDVYRRQLPQELIVESLSRIGLLRYFLASWSSGN